MVEPPGANKLLAAAHIETRRLGVLTEREVPKLVAALDPLAFLDGRVDASYHHRTDARAHHTPKLGAVDRHNLTYVLAVHVECSADRLGLLHASKSSAST